MHRAEFMFKLFDINWCVLINIVTLIFSASFKTRPKEARDILCLCLDNYVWMRIDHLWVKETWWILWNTVRKLIPIAVELVPSWIQQLFSIVIRQNWFHAHYLPVCLHSCEFNWAHTSDWILFIRISWNALPLVLNFKFHKIVKVFEV